MKRLISMDGQVTEGERRFAIWCTVVDRFEEVNGQQTWDSAEELDADDRQAHLGARLIRWSPGHRQAA